MTREDVIRMAREAGIGPVYGYESIEHFFQSAYAAGAAAERKVIMDSLQKQADLATDALDRRWALEMLDAIRARGAGMAGTMEGEMV